jgi:hypothetical protein
MSHTVTITDPRQPDAAPLWESLDHATVEDAYHAARTHVGAAQPDDRIVDEADGVHSVWTAAGDQPPMHVATITIAPSDDLPADPTRPTRKADNA